MVTAKRRLAYFTLGGTIACRAGDSGGALVELTGPELLAGLPEVAEIEVMAVRQVASGDLRTGDVLELAVLVRDAVQAGADAVVISQGTDTLEETSYLLDLLIEADTPVVLTGAMRNASLPGADGQANLLGAIQVAASGLTSGMGTVVVFNDEIHAARFVRKRHTTSTATFGSPLTGPLGQIVEGRPLLFTRPLGRMVIRLPARPAAARVGMVAFGFDDDGALLKQVNGYFNGLVVATFGGGHVPSWLSPSLEELAEAMPVVFGSRTFSGPLLSRTYGYGGSERDLLARGLISAGALDAVHARILLQVCLMAGASRAMIAETFHKALSQEGLVVLGEDGWHHG